MSTTRARAVVVVWTPANWLATRPHRKPPRTDGCFSTIAAGRPNGFVAANDLGS